MNKYRIILRLATACVGIISSLTFIVGIIYYYCDYDFNNTLNMYISEYTIVFMYVCAVLFGACGVLFFLSAYKIYKKNIDS